jgi:4-diphosphocytidyl-2-C-methyl-D-erythritol kinase
MRSVRLAAFAKINLRLHIIGKRPDGYHELRTVFQTISLRDTLDLALTRKPGIALVCNDASLPVVRKNLVWRAIDAMRREVRMRGGVRARLTKRIPAGRGMGGGSSDAAAAMEGMLRLARRSLPAARLAEIAGGLGADVPFFLYGGRALGVGRGDEIYPLPDLPTRTILVISPREIAVPTADAYRWADRRLKLTKSAAASKLRSFCALCWSPQGAPLENDFEPVVFRRYPRLAAIKRALLRGGAAEVALAGSGSAVFGVFLNPAQARRAARRFPNDQSFVCATVSRGEYRRARRGLPGV